MNKINKCEKSNCNKEKIIIVTGPTAVGKTKYVIDLANKLNTEIVSADSMQIYKKMEIGSAKPNSDERQRAKHHLIDFLEPNVEYSVFDYKNDALKIIKNMHSKGLTPIISGGTGLYLHSIIYDMDFQGAGTRDKTRVEYEKYSCEQLCDILIKNGFELSQNDFNNKRRLVRKLEVFESTGNKKDFADSTQKTERYDTEIVVLNRDREELYARINKRVDIMMEAGLLDELRYLLSFGLDENYQSMKGIGYKELILHLKGEISLEEAVELIKRNSRRYAKRQLTWFRRYKKARWIDFSGK